MRILSSLLLALCLCGLSVLAPAHKACAAEDTAYLQAELIPPVWSTDPLRIRFSADEKLCRKAYGDAWSERCFVSIGMVDAPATGIVLREGKGAATPTLPAGEWRWEESSSLIFTPKSPWQANTPFTVDVTRLTLPVRVKLSPSTLKGSTLPLAGQSPQGDVWIDPSASGPRGVSFAIRFTAPVDQNLEKSMTLKAGNTSLGLGKMQVIWGQEATSCLVKVPLTALPDTNTILTLNVPGVRPFALKDDKPVLLAGTLTQKVNVPGKKQLFRISEAKLELKTVESLAREYHLSLKSSLRMPAAALIKALQVVELPHVQNPEAVVPYVWDAAPAVTPGDLEKARPLQVELVQDPGDSGEPLILRVPATPGRYVYCQLPEGFGPAGYPLTTPWSAVFHAPMPDGMVRFLQPGNVLTLTPGGDARLDILTSGVDTLRWRASRIRSEHLNLLQVFTSPAERFNLSSSYETVDPISTALEGTIPLSGGDTPLIPRFSTLPLNALMQGGTGFLFVELTGLRDGKEVDATSRLVMATDLGLVSKLMPDGRRQVFVCSLSSGQPVADATVRILGANGQPVAETRTDTTGQAMLPAVRGLVRQKEAVALVVLRTADNAKQDGDMAWMALDDAQRRVDYSRFPIQGQISSPDNINVYVFGQRGIFRPGETVRFGLVIRRGDWKPLPKDMPLVATLTDPAGRIALRRHLTVADGLAELSWTSQQSSPTGRYRLDVSSPASEDVIGSGVVRMEEFQPDTLAIQAKILRPLKAGTSQQAPAVTKGWLVTPEADAEAILAVSLQNFYGLPAEKQTIRAELSVRPASFSFAGFETFTFPDILPLNNVTEAATPLPEAVTSAEGQVRIPVPLAGYQNRTMLCRMLVEGFESGGGRAVTTETSFLVSPLPVMLGYRLSGAVDTTSYVPQGTQGGLEFVALGPDLHPADPGMLRLSVAERRYRTILATDAQGKYVYEESPVDTELTGTEAKVDPTTGRLEWTMPTDKPGEFLLTVRDTNTRVLARIPFTVAGNDDVRDALATTPADLHSTQLRVRLDKTEYASGDTVNIFLAAPYDGVGLVTLERDTVATHTWFKAPAGNSVHTLTIPKAFEGRGYINVTMGRAITSPEIFMQPHSFATVPLTVNAAGRDMGLTFTTPEQVLPGTTLNAHLTAKHPGTALVFAVDEGVLQLTRFATPDPLRYLLLDRALEVQTDQLFDLLMPVHAQLGKRLPAFGGDMHMGGGRFQNPFKRRSEPPLAWWSGLVALGPQGADVSIPIPAYTNGQVRLMAVAVSPETVGATEARTIVRAPLVIAPQLPLMAAPGDTFEGGISLRNTTDAPLTVSLKLEYTGLRLLPDPQRARFPESVEIAAGKEHFLPVRCVADEQPGEATFTVIASTGAGQVLTREATLSVRPAVLPRQEMRTGFTPLAKDGTFLAEPDTRALYPFMADASASVSAAPLPPLRVLLRGLAAYPYDCVEQSISRAFPLVLLQRRPGMIAVLTPPLIDGKPRADVHARMLEQALTAIRSAFKPQEGLTPWPDAHTVDPLLTAYAGDYLLSLREAGIPLPGDLSTDFFTTLQNTVTSTPESLDAARAQAYGLWVLTRSGVITAQWLDSLREQLNERWNGWEQDVTGSLLAGSYALMNMHDAAQQLLNAGGEGGGQLLESRHAAPMTLLAARSLHIAVLARHFPERLAGRAGTLASRLVEGVNSSTLSTLESALGARALLELAVPLSGAGTVATPEKTDTSFAGAELLCTSYQSGFEPVETQTRAETQPDSLPNLLTLTAPGCTQFRVQSYSGKAPLYWEVSTDGYDRQPPAQAVTNGMEVTRVLKRADGSPLPPDASVVQGSILRVELTARVFPEGSRQTTQLVLADILPGGFELLLTHPQDTLPENEQLNAYNRLDRREDRVIAHATAQASEPVTFVYHLRAVNKGRYILPAAYGEGLFDRTLNSHTPAGMITVQ